MTGGHSNFWVISRNSCTTNLRFGLPMDLKPAYVQGKNQQKPKQQQNLRLAGNKLSSSHFSRCSQVQASDFLLDDSALANNIESSDKTGQCGANVSIQALPWTKTEPSQPSSCPQPPPTDNHSFTHVAVQNKRS